LLPGVVVRSISGAYLVAAGGAILDCVLRGRLRREEGRRVVVGDHVRVEVSSHGASRITEILPRHSVLVRRTASRRERRVIAANVDQVAAVVAVADPPINYHVLDRLLVQAELNRLDACIVLNKLDLLDGEPLSTTGLETYGPAGYPVLHTSALCGRGIDAFGERLAGRITVVAGPSGVGKSSLLNALIPGQNLKIGDLGRTGKGRHTTVAAVLIPLPDGSYVADTPGLQYMGLGDVGPGELAAAFPEFRPFLGECRFADCRHWQEPGCAVRKAVEKGALAERRHRAYVELLCETES